MPDNCFRTVVTPEAQQGVLMHRRKVLTLGSCFADEVGSRLGQRLFDIEVNPFGAVYNPLSLLNIVRCICSDWEPDAEELFEHEGRWHSYRFHSVMSGTTPADTLAKISGTLDRIRRHLTAGTEPPLVILTLGSAVTYRLSGTREIVTNCHKQPAKLFDRQLQDVATVTAAITDTIDTLTAYRPGLTVMLTVSPIRHKADGLHINQLSKSVLLLGAHGASETRPDALYFPAYEIMMDDLRDYRFYAEDMVHPSSQAVDYITGRFMEACCTPATIAAADEGLKLSRSAGHRFGPGRTDQAAEYFSKLLDRISEYSRRHPDANTTVLINICKSNTY